MCRPCAVPAGSGGGTVPYKNGDVIEATIIGNEIKGYINGVEVTSAVDDAYPTGNPGIGFNYGAEDTARDHGLTYYEVETWDD